MKNEVQEDSRKLTSTPHVAAPFSLKVCSSTKKTNLDKNNYEVTPFLMKRGSKRKFVNGGVKDAENPETPQVSKTWDSYTPKMLKKPKSQRPVL
nr:unnamed protein product [Callosobruchus analis]